MARPTEDDPEEAGLPPAQTEEEENEDLTADYALLFTNKSRDPANLLAAGASLPQPAQLALQFQVPRDTRDAALHISLESLRIILGEERSGLAKNLVRCSWLDGEGEAVVDIPRGNHLKTVGYQLSAQTRLLPEEMLYLLEQGAATCLRGGVPLSLQQAYAIMLGGSDHSNKKMPATEEFLVYSYLKRLGYVVRRCREFRKGKVVSHGWIDWTRGHFNALTGYLSSFLFPSGPQGQGYPRPLVRRTSLSSLPTGTDSISSPIYDVWKPQSGFRKSDPGKPGWRVSVVSATSTALEPWQVASLLRRTQVFGIPAIIAIVDGGNISFIGMDSKELKIEKLVKGGGVLKRIPGITRQVGNQ